MNRTPYQLSPAAPRDAAPGYVCETCEGTILVTTAKDHRPPYVRGQPLRDRRRPRQTTRGELPVPIGITGRDVCWPIRRPE